VESSRSASQAVRNDHEAHPMSPVSPTTVKSSRSHGGEDESERSQTGVVPQHRCSLNNRCCAHHHGGVGGRGMPEQAVRLKVEVCGGGLQSPSERTSAQGARRPSVAAEVGAVHSSSEGSNDARAKGPHLNEANKEGKDVVMAPQGQRTPEKKSKNFDGKLCREAKAAKPTVTRKNVLGKPDAGEPPVRFDEGWGMQVLLATSASSAYSTYMRQRLRRNNACTMTSF